MELFLDKRRVLVTGSHRGTRAAREGHGSDWAEVEARAAAEWMPNPTGRIGRPEEVGHLVAFLASDLAGYINGANLRIDGGAIESL